NPSHSVSTLVHKARDEVGQDTNGSNRQYINPRARLRRVSGRRCIGEHWAWTNNSRGQNPVKRTDTCQNKNPKGIPSFKLFSCGSTLLITGWIERDTIRGGNIQAPIPNRIETKQLNVFKKGQSSVCNNC